MSTIWWREFNDEAGAKEALLQSQSVDTAHAYWVEKVGKTRSKRTGTKWIVKRRIVPSPIKKKRTTKSPVLKSLRKIATVGDLRRFLSTLPDNVVSNAMQVVYGADDEGNSFQASFNAPTVAYIEPQDSPYRLRIVGEDTEDAIPVALIN